MKQTKSTVNIQSTISPQEEFGVYLDCNATAPLEPAVRDLMLHHLNEELGNAGSRTHEYGVRAGRAVESAREQVASVVKAQADEVVFTSGATESNNIALLGLAAHGEANGKRHIVSTAIEHKAILEPLGVLAKRGFDVTILPVESAGYVEPQAVREAVRNDTLLVSVMHINNETGVRQPIQEIASLLQDSDAYLHVDAAQGFGKAIDDLQHLRIDLISASSHKVYGPLGVGALITRKRGFKRPALAPLIHGGGQERGLRPGTLPVYLIAAFGLAAELAQKHCVRRADACQSIRSAALEALRRIDAEFNGDPARMLPHVVNFSVPGLDSEAIILALKGVAAVSNGSACTSQSYQPSHVLKAMGIPEDNIMGAVRLSWCHLTPAIDWESIVTRIESLR